MNDPAHSSPSIGRANDLLTQGKLAQAESELPDQVDPEAHSDLLGKLGIDPQDLLGSLGGGLGDKLGGLGG